MSHAIIQERTGGPDVLQWRPNDVPAPGPGEARVRQVAVGLNFIDVYVRTGAYPLLALPGSPGMEAAGVVDAVGAGVDRVRPGDRVVYVTPAPGAYAESRNVDADRLVLLPEGIDEATAAATFLKGLTAMMLVQRVHTVAAGDRILVHAAGGATGGFIARCARHLGALVIGTAGGEAKAEAARNNGCHHVIDYQDTEFVGRVQQCTDGRGADVVFDGVGAATINGSIEALAPRGHLVSFGNASGPPAPIEISDLAAKSLSLSRPSLFHYIAEPAELDLLATQCFDALRQGLLPIQPTHTFALAEAAAAHRALEARELVGPTVLLA